MDGHIRTLTVTAQDTSSICQQGLSSTPCTTFFSDLHQFLTYQRHLSHGNFLVGDFSEHLTTTYDVLTQLYSDFNFVDLMLQLNSTDSPNTFISGHDWIDFALCDDWIASAAICSCYRPSQLLKSKSYRTDRRTFRLRFRWEC